ncbi:hypothetical protein ACFFRR_007601 [Megaselia abdita]
MCSEKVNSKSDIYDTYDDIIKTVNGLKLHKEFKEFRGMTENFQRVRYVEELLLKYEHIQNFKKKLVMQDSKSNERAIALRNEGNKNFMARNYFEALQLYNKSICYSEDSKNIGIGYSNRSAVFFQLKMYKQCLENIEMSKKTKNFPENLLAKLNKREEDCKKFLSTQKREEDPVEFPLSFKNHEVVPYIANCLALGHTKEEGRFIYTKVDLKPGDCVAIEDPYCTALLPPMRYIRCTYCTKENCFTLIPCNHCTGAMFCDKVCRDKAWNSFHKYECKVIDFILDTFPKIHQTALRICLTALSLFGNVDDCRAFCEDPANQSKTVFDLNFDELTKTEEYKAVYGLITNQEKRDTEDLFQRAVVVATIKNILIEFTPLKSFLGKNIENENFFANLLFKHVQTSSTNGHSLDLIEQVNNINDDVHFATGIYPFLSLFNHSCAPNTVRISKGTTYIVFALRHIEANGKLFENYGSHFLQQPKMERQQYLSSQFRFVCKCEACENNYNMAMMLPRANIPSTVNTPKDNDHLSKFDFQYALKNLEKYTEYLKIYGERNYPNFQIQGAEECFKMALKILVGAVHLRAKILSNK